METSILVARILSLIFIATAVASSFNKDYFRKLTDDLVSSPGLLYFIGMVEFVVGFLIVSNHNFWVAEWIVLVTLLGWGMLLEGFLVMAAPQVYENVGHSFLLRKKYENTWTFVNLALGLVLGYFGFFV